MNMKPILSIALLFAASLNSQAIDTPKGNFPVAKKDVLTVNNRPAPKERLFRSEAVEKKIKEVASQLTNLRLAWMFVNCYPNTIDTTVHYEEKDADGLPDTFVYTGDIHAMWLRDSGAQVFPYVKLAPKDKHLQRMLAGVILRQLKCINIDPYANAFNKEPNPNGDWMKDMTRMTPMLHERKWEIDSLCYVLRLCYEYWQVTGDTSVFGESWIQAVQNILTTFRDQQRKEGRGNYKFQRRTERQLDTMNNDGWGAPVNPVGLIASAFRPSDDATTLLFLVPSNFMAVTQLRHAAEILTKVNQRTDLAGQCTDLAFEVNQALQKYAIHQHPKYGPIYAFERRQRALPAGYGLPGRRARHRPNLPEHAPLRLERGQPLLLPRSGRRRHWRTAHRLPHALAHEHHDARLHQHRRPGNQAVHRDADADRRRPGLHARVVP